MRRSLNKTKGFAAAFVLLAALCVSGPALAQTNYVGATPPEVGSTDVGSSRGVAVLGASGGQVAGVGGASGQAGSRGLLAFTGADLLMLLFVAGALVGTGAIIVRSAHSTAD